MEFFFLLAFSIQLAINVERYDPPKQYVIELENGWVTDVNKGGLNHGTERDTSRVRD
jgi:hypothetical protein